MADAELYDADILAWSERQAAALRRLAERRDLPNDLDLTNVVEEIEDVGKSEFRSVESFVQNILVHVIFLWAQPNAPAVRGWHSEVEVWRATVEDRISPSMRARMDMTRVWRYAIRIASARLRVWDETKSAMVRVVLKDVAYPVDIAELCDDELDISIVLSRLPSAS